MNAGANDARDEPEARPCTRMVGRDDDRPRNRSTNAEAGACDGVHKLGAMWPGVARRVLPGATPRRATVVFGFTRRWPLDARYAG